MPEHGNREVDHGLHCASAKCRVDSALVVSTAAFSKGARIGSDPQGAAPKHEAVDLFAAQQSGELEIEFIARDEHHGRLLVTNHSDRPLSVRLPEAFAAAPVLAQFGNNNRPANAANNPQTPQSVGTGVMPGGGNRNVNFFNNPGGGNRNNGLQGIFNVAPEKTVTLRLDTLCLEHGKPTPRPTHKYEVKPLETVNSQPAVRELLKLYAGGGHDRQVAQAAVWHLANDVRWQDLAAKRRQHANNTSEPFFTPRELADAKKLVSKVERDSGVPTTAESKSTVANVGRD